MPVLLIFHTLFGVCCLLLTLCTVFISELVDKVLSEFTTLDVYLNFPTIVAIEDLIDKLTSCKLRWLFAK